MNDKLHEQKILIIDYGSQYTQNIARKIREAQVYCEIHPCTISWEDIRNAKPCGIILSGGPASVLEQDAPLCDPRVFEMGVPVLGICYGLQLITHLLKGKINPAEKREFGRARLKIPETSPLFEGIENETTVWMSHGDRITQMPEGFIASAHTDNSPVAAISNRSARIYGLQFHPEVVHTDKGRQIIDNFLFRICECERNWKMDSLAESAIEEIKKQAGQERVICGLSGGVDSSVVAVLIHKAIGERLTCIFIDNGLLRYGERDKVEKTFRDNFHFNLVVVDAAEIFLERLKGVTDPEQKRKIIGNVFIEVFEAEAKKLGKFDFLAQGTLYPDVIESVSFKGGPSAVIKSHHNVGGLPEKMAMKLIEPLREFFKDEARLMGKELGIPNDILQRQPFPGPGLAIRILGAITHEKLEILRAADKILLEEIKNAGYYEKLWQSFMVLLPVKTVGVMGDSRTYENVAAIRAVTSADGMTADWAKLPYDLLGNISNRIINEVRGINRVTYDITSKPPGTIEWE